jgi:hypothetical protein
VVGSVVNSLSHLFGSSETYGVGNTSSKRSSGTFDTRGGVFRVGELRVTRSHGVVLTESLHFVQREVISGKVEPRVKEHRSVSSREDETITVDPFGVLGIVLKLSSVKSGTDFGTTQRKTHVTRVSGGNGVHSKTTSFVGSSGKSGLDIYISSSRHLKNVGIADSEATSRSCGESVGTGGECRSGDC